MSVEALLLLPKLRVVNSNSISSPLTWGFPSITSILGFMHALERRLQSSREDAHINLTAAGVVCHEFEPQVDGHYEKTFCLTRKPLTKEGATAAIVEEGRAHLTISLLIQLSSEQGYGNDYERRQLAEKLGSWVNQSRLAGGSIMSGPAHSCVPEILPLPLDSKQQKQWVRKLLPGFGLISRADLLQGVDDILEEWFDHTCVHHEPPTEPHGAWITHRRQAKGWVVPIPVGYQGISTLFAPGSVKNARDEISPFRFVENIYSLGQWLSPHRLEDLTQLLWSYDVDVEQGIYRCVNTHSLV